MRERINVLFIVASESSLLPWLQALNNGGLAPVWQWLKTAEALRTALADNCWDAIITEYNLPGFDALAGLSVVHQSQLDIPFLVISDTVGERLAVEMIKAGAHDYLLRDDLARLPEILLNELQNARERSKHKQDVSNLQKTEDKYRELFDNAADGICPGYPSYCKGFSTEIRASVRSEARTKAAFEQAVVGFVESDMKTGRLTSVNPYFCKMTGYSQAELLEMTIHDISHPDDAAQSVQKIHQLFLGQIESFRIEKRYLCKDGTVFWAETAVCLIHFPKEPDTHCLAIVQDISDRKRLEAERTKAQQQLQQLNQRLEAKVAERTKALLITQSAMDLAADCVFMIRPDGRFHYVNDIACSRLGYLQEQLLTLSVTDIYPTISLEDWSQIWQTIQQQPSMTIESQVQSKRGGLTPVELTANHLEFDGDTYALAFVRDITKRKLADIKLQRENAFRQQILENMAEGLCVCHPIDEFPFIYHTVWNRKMNLITGYSLDEINHLGVIPGLVPNGQDLRTYAERYTRKLKTGKDTLSTREAEIQCKDGQQRTIHISTSILSDADGQFTALSLIQDITQYKQSQQSARLLVDVVESTDDAIITKRLDGTITSWNPAAVALFGYTEAEAVGQSISILFSPERIDLEPQIIERLRKGERIRQFETINLHKSGVPIEVSATISPLRNDKGKIVGASKIVRDITKRKQAEMQLRLTNEELLRATQLKDEFLANMSHELRTPLNAILGMAESLQAHIFGEIHQQQIKPLQMIQRSGNHLLELINDILDVAKIESGQMELDITSTAVDPICRESLAFIMQQTEQKSIQVETNLPTHLPNVPADRRRIRQVLINLLSNAVKFTPRGGHIRLEVSLQTYSSTSMSTADKEKKQHESRESLQVETSSKADNQADLTASTNREDATTFVRIAIGDTGIGIAPENISKLFEPFIQIDSDLNRKYSGTGLGLALVKRIVDLHGGTVGVTSNLGHGSCFTIDLPCTLAAPFSPTMSLQIRSNFEGNQSASMGAFLILLVDDKDANSITMMSYLRAKGYCVQIVASAQEIIDLAQSTLPELIVLDSHLHETDILDVIQQIRYESGLINVPIVSLVAPEMEQVLSQYYSLENHRSLTKPFEMKQLTDTIQQLL
ncbi:MAG: PAS domain S-box protein [Leptolyngbyaceae cyanobacterium]